MLKRVVSVIIPNYNNASSLAKSIDSCLAQGDALKEIIVVDDISTDNSLDILRSYKNKYPDKIQYFTNPKKGANNARNYGYEQSSGDYIQWLDADDVILPEKFNRQIEILESTHSDIAYSNFQFDYYCEGRFTHSEVKLFRQYEDNLLELLKDNWNAVHSYLIKRTVAEKLRNGTGWNPETKVGQDREYMTMAAILGARFIFVPGVFAVYLKQDSGTTSGMAFKKRLELNQNLENKFRKEIVKQDWISDRKKTYYEQILDTHKIKACFYHKGIRLHKRISPFGIEWSMMHWKMRMAMPYLLISKNLQFYLNRE